MYNDHKDTKTNCKEMQNYHKKMPENLCAVPFFLFVYMLQFYIFIVHLVLTYYTE